MIVAKRVSLVQMLIMSALIILAVWSLAGCSSGWLSSGPLTAEQEAQLGRDANALAAGGQVAENLAPGLPPPANSAAALVGLALTTAAGVATTILERRGKKAAQRQTVEAEQDKSRALQQANISREFLLRVQETTENIVKAIEAAKRDGVVNFKDPATKKVLDDMMGMAGIETVRVARKRIPSVIRQAPGGVASFPSARPAASAPPAGS